MGFAGGRDVSRPYRRDDAKYCRCFCLRSQFFSYFCGVKVFLENMVNMKRLVLLFATVILPIFMLSAQDVSVTSNGHDYVDLGLSVKWATCNVGASSPSDYGDYYAWGETSTKSSYDEDNSKTYGKSMGNIGGNSSYDVARYKWGGSWRLPSKAEMQELVDKCTWTWTTQGGHNGYKVTGKNGKSIFLPAAGWRYGTSPYDIGEGGYYWGSAPNESSTLNAYGLSFYSSRHYVVWGYRYNGFSVRPVIQISGLSSGNKPAKQNTTTTPKPTRSTTGKVNGHDYVDLGLSVKWATCNVGASTPSDYGDYYAWGETSTKSSYTEDNSKTYGKSMGNIGGNSSYDVARAKWGGSWRLPTKAELEELETKCTWTWTTQGGHKGYKVTSKINGKSIFLPAAGWRRGTSRSDVGEYGYYWGSTPGESSAYGAYYLGFYSSFHGVGWRYRINGFSVRPVVE